MTATGCENNPGGVTAASRSTVKPPAAWPETLRAFGRGLALFLGVFSLLNIAGQLRFPGFDANHWWIDFRPLDPRISRLFLAFTSILMVSCSVQHHPPVWRRTLTLAVVGLLLANTARNTARFYILLAHGTISTSCPAAFSIFVGAALTLVFVSVALQSRRLRNEKKVRAQTAFVIAAAASFVCFPLGQMFCFGRTDYRRPADAIVVFGARVYADGRCSDALADRVRTACRLYAEGFAPRLILSGGPGDGKTHETEAMQTMALGLGVPPDAITLDCNGVNTHATVANTCALFQTLNVRHSLVVSHFYHLPRIKMSYQRRGWEVYTVPAKETYLLTKMPIYIAREVVALWVYYLQPLLP